MKLFKCGLLDLVCEYEQSTIILNIFWSAVMPKRTICWKWHVLRYQSCYFWLSVKGKLLFVITVVSHVMQVTISRCWRKTKYLRILQGNQYWIEELKNFEKRNRTMQSYWKRERDSSFFDSRCRKCQGQRENTSSQLRIITFSKICCTHFTHLQHGSKRNIYSSSWLVWPTL